MHNNLALSSVLAGEMEHCRLAQEYNAYLGPNRKEEYVGFHPHLLAPPMKCSLGLHEPHQR
uniref:Ferritin n=1 Tax=Echinococcus granulosus TaxID=6210 RepID=A0A068WZM9_ECHGR|nr:hypothetical protein EgrG_002047200 [Echinococcus granulosus]